MNNWRAQMIRLDEGDLDDMMALQSRMVAALPSPRWYFTSSRDEFAQEVRDGRVTGIRGEDGLIALCIFHKAAENPDNCYAARVGRRETTSVDFQDVMVDPAWRRRGIHSAFLALCEENARREGLSAVYATVDPDNAPSCGAFEKAGYRRIAVQPAYDGRIRAYYRLALDK